MQARHTLATFALALLIAGPAPASAVQLTPARDYEVLRDELPDTLPADELEVVVLSDAATCIRKPVTLWGVRTGWTNTDNDLKFCHAVVPALMATTPEPLLFRQQTLERPQTSVTATVTALSPQATRRYVALVRWSADLYRYGTTATFEEVVVDRQTGRWLWHALRRVDTYKFEMTETLTTWGQTLHHDLVQAVTQRGRVRQAMFVAGARWVPPDEMATWAPGDKAGLILVNRDHKESSSPTSPFAGAEIRRAGEPPAPNVDRAGSSWQHAFNPLRAPNLTNMSYAALELPPGDYVINFGGELRTTLVAGEKRVLSIEVQFLRLGDTQTARQLEWFKEGHGKLYRHAFLADTHQPQGQLRTVPLFTTP
jgi:hypothetical protein